jgi:uncharacterized protein YyaL (SSP411 family)
MAGFLDVLRRIQQLWEHDRKRLVSVGDEVSGLLNKTSGGSSRPSPPTEELLRSAYRDLSSSFDHTWGGFGGEPKFPTPHRLSFLLRWYNRTGDTAALAMVRKTLDAMRYGGIFDQIGFGFHRYAVDRRWLVPHFEKMLYDQALLARAYTEAFLVTGEGRYEETAQNIFEYVRRDMTSPLGGFFSAEDADSEGKEGLFYLWTPEQVTTIAGRDEGELFCRFFGITPAGNFEEGFSIPHIGTPADIFCEREGIDLDELSRSLERTRTKLFAVRETRTRPQKDDKVITAHNGLMIVALAEGYRAFGDRGYLDMAQGAARFILDALRGRDGTLMRRYREGESAHPAFLEDYAFFVWGLLSLYEACFDFAYFRDAKELNDLMLELFWDDDAGGFFFTEKGGEAHIAQVKDIYDGATPSGNSVAAHNLLRLASMTGDASLEEKAERLFSAFSEEVAGHPTAYTHFLSALDFAIGPRREVVFSGDPEEEAMKEMVDTTRSVFSPTTVYLMRPAGGANEELFGLAPFLSPLIPQKGKATTYVCEDFTCREPILDADLLRKVLKGDSKTPQG